MGVLHRIAPNGRAYTYVNGYTWFWTEPHTFTVRNEEAHAGATWVKVTASPITLEYVPGDGKSSVVRNGPGRDINKLTGYRTFYDKDPNGCSYKYTRITTGNRGYPNEQLTATIRINLHVTWVGSQNTSGELPIMNTDMKFPLGVAELHNVVVG